MKVASIKFEDFELEEEVLTNLWIREGQNQNTKRAKQDPKYVDVHALAFAKKGYRWPPRAEEVSMFFTVDTAACLNQRPLELGYFVAKAFPPPTLDTAKLSPGTKSSTDLSFADLNLSMERMYVTMLKSFLLGD